MGESYVGIVHPCKIYGILTAGKPFVFIGPARSHIGELVHETGLGARCGGGDVQALTAEIERVRHHATPDAVIGGYRQLYLEVLGRAGLPSRPNEACFRDRHPPMAS